MLPDVADSAARQQEGRATPSAGALDASPRHISLAMGLLFICVFSVDVIVLPGDPPRGIALAAPFPLTSDITVQLSCQFALLSVLKISTTIAVDRVRSGSTSRTLRVLHDSRCKRSSFHETTTVRLVDAIFFIFVYRQVVKRERIRLTDLLAFDRPIG